MKIKSNKCLNVTIEKTGRNYKGLDVTATNRYESFSTISNKAAEIYSTRTTVSDLQGDQKLFMVLADLYPISNSRTKVEIYYYTSLGGQFGKAYKSGL